VRVPTRGTAQVVPDPYMDVELCFEADPSQLPLARSVAAEVAQREAVDSAYVEKVRHVVGMLAAALIALADRDTKVRCLFRILESEVRVRVSVDGAARPSPEAKSEHARLLDQLLVSASTFTHPNGSGGLSVVSDAFIPIDDDRHRV
jgi:serine/threonine-protein kinase RsbW